MPVRQFLGGNPETYENSTKTRENPCNHVMARHIHSYIIQNTQNSSLYLDNSCSLGRIVTSLVPPLV